MSPMVQEHARARLITDAPDLPTVYADLRYEGADDPHTVHVSFPGGPDWSFGRDLLESGLRAPVERDGIRIWPCGRAQLIVEEHTDGRVRVVQFDSAPLIRFLRRTHLEAPARTARPAPAHHDIAPA